MFITVVSCHSEEEKLYTYKVENNSGRNINILAFSRKDEFRAPVTTLIGAGEEIIKTYEGDPPSRPNGYSYVAFFQGDSIVINYANKKQQIFVEEDCGGSKRNPLNFCVYNNTKEIFVFTEEDYQDAHPCDGACT